ncbi:hypothetical protein FDP41_009573 [Naegleria fowleri]|uniref:Sulphur transport domain-containing protein n=1 Tax=Naegleria fowleri TaxID=5763 RepID=A0A6A5BDI9_NAEFO|nr:uncharacterized protein FDP41_009573 [Naegleria fowleri]KAF0972165.1 hypothetical protein FDP41_009573 [Naegleria fowleri]
MSLLSCFDFFTTITSSQVNWKEQFQGWRRRVSFLLALLIILSVVGFSIGYFAGHDLKGASTWRLGFVMIISVAFGYALVQSSYGFGAHFRVFYKQQYELVDIKKIQNSSDDDTQKLIHEGQTKEEAVSNPHRDEEKEQPPKEIILTPDKALPQYSTMQAHCIMLAVATFLFSMLYIIDKAAGWHMYSPEASPMTISIVIGGFLFGIGMQLGDACASGTLFTIGGGSLWSVYLLVFFVCGSVIATALQSAGDWNIGFKNHAGLSLLFPGTFLRKAFGIMFFEKNPWLDVHCSCYSFLPQKKNKKNQMDLSGDAEEQSGLINQDYEIDTRSPLQKLMSFVSMIVLDLFMDLGLNCWIITRKIPKFLDGFSLKSLSHTFKSHKQGDHSSSIFTTLKRILNNIGNWLKNNIGIAIAKIIGGICMGIGAKFGYGCNIGAYFSGVSCMSIHGYSWITMALLGGYIGAVVRPLFGYKKRKVACGTVCNTASIY